MKKRFWMILLLPAFILCLTSCQPAGGDFVPIPQENATIIVVPREDKDWVFQVYDDQQVSVKVRGQWDVRFGASSFFVDNKQQNQQELNS